MRVLHLINAFNKGGVEKWLLSMLEEIPRELCEMDVLCKGKETGPWTEVAESLGATVYHHPLRPSHVRFVRGLSTILRAGEYDLVHNHLHVYSGCATWVARRIGIPVFTTFHNTRFAPGNAWFGMPVLRHLRTLYAEASTRYAILASDLISCISQGIVDSMNPQEIGMESKFRILTYGVDVPERPTEEERIAFRSQFGWPWNTPIICHVGRFFPQKNHGLIIEIFSRVVRYVPDAKLLLIGDGPLKPTIASMVESRRLDESVMFAGLLDDVPSVLKQCDVFLFPSNFEGFGLASLEANAAGLPVVGSRIPGLEEAVENGKTAILHALDDVSGMTDSLVKLITDPARSKLMGQAGRLRAKEQFSTDAAIERLLDLYDECLRMSGNRSDSCENRRDAPQQRFRDQAS